MNSCFVKTKLSTRIVQAGLLFVLTLFVVTSIVPVSVHAAPNQQINYQGKLTNSSNVAVADGLYQIVFRLYTVPTGGSAIWTETLSGANEVTVTNGLFSVMLGSTTALTSVDFNQALYLGVTIEADAEMSPRKVLGTVPAAFEAINANTVGGVASTSLVRNDQTNTVTASSSNTILSLVQNGIGKILSVFAGAYEAFTITASGNVGIGSSTPSTRLSVTGNSYFGGNVTATGTIAVSGTATFATTTISSSTITTLNLVNALPVSSGGTGAITAPLARTNLGATTVGANLFTLTNPGALSFIRINSDNTVSAVATSTLGINIADTTGTLAATRGGTGLSTITQNQLLLGGAGNTWSQVATSSLGLSAAFSTIAQLDTLITDVTGVTGTGSFVLSAAPTFTGTSIFANSSTTNATTTNATTTNFAIAGLTSGRVPYLTTGGRLIDSTNFTFDGTSLTLGTDVSLSRGATNRLDLATGDSLNLVSGSYQIASTNVLTNNTLGTGILNSSLTSLGTLTALTVSGTSTFATTTAASSSIGTLTLTNALAALSGGTGFNTYATGDFIYASGANTLAKRTIGSTGNVLSVVAGVPTWVATSTLGISGGSSFTTSSDLAALLSDETGSAGGGLVVFSNAPTFTGTSIFANSSTTNATTTNATTTTFAISGLTSGRVPYLTAGGRLIDSANFTFNGTSLTLGTDVSLSRGAANRLDLATGDSLNLVSGDLMLFGVDYLTGNNTSKSVTIGELAGATFTNNTTDNIAVGFEAGRFASTTNADENIYIGRGAGLNSSGFGNNFLGYSVASNNTGIYNNIIGQLTGFSNTGSYNNIFGFNAGSSNTGSDSNIFGNEAGQSNTGSRNNIIGDGAGYVNTGSYNNLFGDDAGYTNTGSYSEFIGFETAARMSASSTVAIGGLALRGGGGFAGLGNLATTTNNIAIGYGAGYNVQTGGNNNLLLGYQAADSLTTGANNIIIGYDVEAPSNTGSNQLNIGNLIFGNNVNGTGTVLSTGNIGIGSTSPSAKLTVAGTFLATGTSTLGSTTVTGTLSLLGTASNIALGSNYLSGDGGDEGVFVDSIGRVGVGTSDTTFAQFSVVGGVLAPGSISTNADDVYINSIASGMTIGTASTSNSRINFADDDDSNVGDIVYNHVTDSLLLGANNGNAFIALAGSTGNVGIGTSTPGAKLTVTGDIFSSGLISSLNDHFSSVVFTDGWAANDFREVVQGFTASAGASGNFTITINATRGSIAESSTYLVSTAHAGATVWREAVAVNDNSYVGLARCFTLDVNNNANQPQFRVRALRPGSVCGDAGSPITVNVRVRSEGNNLGWTALSGSGSGGSVTGFQSSVGNSWTLYTGNPTDGAGILAITANKLGNIGIGTSSPLTKLHIESSTGESSILTRTTLSNSFAGYLTYDSSNVLSGSLSYANATAGVFPNSLFLGTRKANESLIFITGGLNERMRIDGSGNVGIGTSTPAEKLHIAGGSIRLDDVSGVTSPDINLLNNTGGNIARIINASNVGGRFEVYSGGALTVNLDAASNTPSYINAGNFGIGTTTPGSKLTVVGGNLSVAGGRPILLDPSGSAAGVSIQGDAGGWAFGYHAKGGSGTDRGGFGFFGSGDALNQYYIGPSYTSPIMTLVASTNNVGVGTTSPSNKLTIQAGHTDTIFRMQAENGAFDDSNLFLWASEPGVTYTGAGIGNNFRYSGTFGREVTTIGASYIRLLDNEIRMNVINSSGSQTEALTITGGGNVGIGTTTAAAKLTIADGNILATRFSSATIWEGVRFEGRRARGTVSSPAHPELNDYLVRLIGANGVTGTGESFIGVLASENHTASAQGSSVNIFTTANGGTTSFERVKITSEGDMAIGTTTPTHRLTVQKSEATNYVARIINSNTANTADGLLISLGVANASRAAGNYFVGFSTLDGTVAGKIQGGANAVVYTTTAADLAEYFPVSSTRVMPQPGEIVTLDPTNDGGVMRAEGEVVPFGIIATNPGFLGNGPICQARDNNCDANYAKDNAIVSLSGQVPVKVNLEGGPIAIGDEITLSSVAGVGMRATQSGVGVVGIALEAYSDEATEGVIRVFVENRKYQTLADLARQKLFTVDLSINTDVFTDLADLAEGKDTVWSRLVTLAEGFKDGMLTLLSFRATETLCINDTCIDEATLESLLELQQQQNNQSGGGENNGSGGEGSGGGAGSGSGDEEDPPPAENDPPPTDPSPIDPPSAPTPPENDAAGRDGAATEGG